MIQKFYKYWLMGTACLLGVSALGCTPGPRTLVMRDALTGQPVNSVVLVMELRGDYDASDYDPMAGVYRQDRIDRYRKKYDIHGYGPTKKHSFGPGFYYNDAYLSQFPCDPPVPDQVRTDVINSGWRIFVSELPRDYEATYSVTQYFLFKRGYLPMAISAGSMKMLADSKGNVRVALRPIAAGEFASDWQVIRIAKSMIALSRMSRIKPSRAIQNRVLDILSDSLVKITALPSDPAPYPDFNATQAEARKLLEHIQAGSW